MAGRRTSATLDSLLIKKDIDVISSGYGNIDYVSDCGGLFPKGVITELAGLKSTSKTSLVLDTIAYNMHKNPSFRVLYADFEKMVHSQGSYLLRLGIDIESENFTLLSPDTMEEGCDAIRRELMASKYDLVVVDTVAAMRPKTEKENKTGETKQMGLRSKLMSEFLRNLTADFDTTGDAPAVVFVNQLYKDITCTFGVKYDSPVAGALEFYAGIRYQLKEKMKIKSKVINPNTLEEEDLPTHMLVEITNVKNKMGRPHLKTSYFYTYGFGIDPIPKLAEIAYNLGIIKNKGASKAVFLIPSDNGEVSITGRSAMWNTLAENIPLAKSVAKELDILLSEKSGEKTDFWQKEVELYDTRLTIRNKYNDLDDFDQPLKEVDTVTPDFIELVKEEQPVSLDDELFSSTPKTGKAKKIDLGL